MNISCAEFQGVRYGFKLNHLKPADDPAGLYRKMNTSALRNAPQSAGNCISIGNDFRLNIPAPGIRVWIHDGLQQAGRERSFRIVLENEHRHIEKALSSRSYIFRYNGFRLPPE